MPRPSRFTDDDVLDAALACVQGRDVSMADVAAALNGPVGSIYHRFPSREVLLVRLWLRSVMRFQAGLFDLEGDGEPADELVAMAVHVPRYCREHPEEAVALTLFRQEQLLIDGPTEVREAAAAANVDVEALTRRMVRRRYGLVTRRTVALAVTATRTCPYGLVRPYLGQRVPHVVDDAVAAAARAIMALGDK